MPAVTSIHTIMWRVDEDISQDLDRKNRLLSVRLRGRLQLILAPVY